MKNDMLDIICSFWEQKLQINKAKFQWTTDDSMSELRFLFYRIKMSIVQVLWQGNLEYPFIEGEIYFYT